jgi:hypothetical protein
MKIRAAPAGRIFIAQPYRRGGERLTLAAEFVASEPSHLEETSEAFESRLGHLFDLVQIVAVALRLHVPPVDESQGGRVDAVA